MEMTLKLVNVVNLYKTIKAILEDENLNNDVVFKFQLLTIAKSIETYAVNFELIKNEKINEFGKQTEDKKNVYISPDDTQAIEKFNKVMNELLATEVTFTAAKLGAKDIFDKNLKTEYLVGLYDMIEIE